MGGAISFLATPVASSEALGTGEESRHPLLRHAASSVQAARGYAATVGFRRAKADAGRFDRRGRQRRTSRFARERASAIAVPTG